MGFHSPQARAEYEVAYDKAFTTLPTPAEQRDLRTAWGSVRVYRFGQEGPRPLVLLPGRAGSSIMWEPNLAALAAEHPVWTVDLIGEPGRSEQTAPIRDAADQAAWLDAVLTALDLRNVHLVGYSFGGWLAANLAIRAPGRLASLALIVMPWNPALWWQMLRLRVAVELDCDARVLRDADARSYGDLLLEVARPRRRLMLLGATAFAERASQLERRIRAIGMRRGVGARGVRVLAISIGVAAVSLAWVAPRPAVPPVRYGSGLVRTTV